MGEGSAKNPQPLLGLGNCLDTEEEFWGYDVMILGTISPNPSFGIEEPKVLGGE